MADISAPDPQKASKRFVVYDKHDRSKWFSFDPCSAQCWQLESHESDWDPFDCYFRQTTERTLYRLPNKSWVLIEEDSHVEVGSLGDPTYRVLTDAEAAEQLLRSGHVPPDDVIHHVAEKLSPPPPAVSKVANQAVPNGTQPEEPPTSDETSERLNTFFDVYGPSKVRLMDFDQLAVVELLRLPHEDEAIGYCYDRGDFAKSFLYRLADGRFVLHSWDQDDPHKGKKAYLLTPDQASHWLNCHSYDLTDEMKSLLSHKRAAEIAEKEIELTQLSLVDVNELDIDEAVAVGHRMRELERQIDASTTTSEVESKPDEVESKPAATADNGGQTLVPPGQADSGAEAKQTGSPDRPLAIFFSYSHKDEKLREQTGKHLSLLKRDGLITGWHDRKIGAGTEWKGQIDQHLNSAGIILLLVSADFLASNYCYDVEMKRAMERHEAGEARVIPIILKPCDWYAASFGKLQALPKDGHAITKWRNREEAFTNVAQGIRAAVVELAAGPKNSASQK